MSQTHSLQEEAYEFLKKSIADGHFEPKKIYSLNAVAAMLNMSKTPVRDALQKLSQEELIEILPSRGFRLHYISPKEIEAVYHLRCAIEGYCAYYLAQLCREDPSRPEISWMRDNLNAQKNAIQDGVSSQRFLLLDQAFHSIIIRSVVNQRFISILNLNRDRVIRFTLRSLEADGILNLTFVEHEKIFDAIRTGKPIDSQAAIWAHLATPLKMNLANMTE